jgi:gliding motility-associated lipoprotein GldD
MPEATYHSFDSSNSGNYSGKNFPFGFQISNQAIVENISDSVQTNGFNLNYPRYGAKIYCAYFSIHKKELSEKSEESRRLAYFHAIKADGIEELTFDNLEQNVFGRVYIVKGNVASPVQFVLTDSVRSFFRGALYFDQSSNGDSIAPVLAHINKDIQILMESFQWKR